MILFVVANFFRGRRWRRANDDWPATPLLHVLLFWISFGAAVLLGSLAVTATMSESYLAATAAAIAGAVSLACSVVLWRKLNC
ncbi:MAG TPA: hypothetical protein VL284_01955 [Thermoanaerobaculia bacterium]|nr:hypothetical protein [Thermoanaerobaculia bacterium]